MQLYLTALDEQVKLPDENPSIGIIICKNKDKTYVEYALKNISAPIGVATYQLRNTLPEEMKALLPEPEEIVKRLKILELQLIYRMICCWKSSVSVIEYIMKKHTIKEKYYDK